VYSRKKKALKEKSANLTARITARITASILSAVLSLYEKVQTIAM
jgi:hypothetical protein